MSAGLLDTGFDMEKLGFFELCKGLEGLDAWLGSLGVPVLPNDRVHEAVKVIRKAHEASEKWRNTGVGTLISHQDWFPIVEAVETYDIMTAFANDKSAVLSQTLKRALSGPAQPIHENSKNRLARNIWFELALAAEWKARGACVNLQEPDLRLIHNEVTFLIACKRPASARSIQANIRKALKQLKRNLDGELEDAFGVVAISLNCSYNPGDKVFTGEVRQLQVILEAELRDLEPYLSTINDPRICCLILHIATPGVGDRNVDLVRASFTVVQELGNRTKGGSAFMDHARQMNVNAKQSWEPFEPWNSE